MLMTFCTLAWLFRFWLLAQLEVSSGDIKKESYAGYKFNLSKREKFNDKIQSVESVAEPFLGSVYREDLLAAGIADKASHFYNDL